MAKKKIGRHQRQKKEEEVYEDVAPDMAPADSSDDNDSTIEEESDDVDDEEEYDSAIDEEEESNSDADVDPQVSDGYDDSDDDDDDNDDNDDEEGDEFEEQGSSSDEDDDEKGDDDDEYEDDEVEILDDLDDLDIDSAPRSWPKTLTEKKRSASGKSIAPSSAPTNGSIANETRMTTVTNGDDQDPADIAQWMHADDLSSDDEDDGGIHNRIGRVPLHWYDDYEHIGYDAHGKKVIKSKSSSNGRGIDLLDAALAAQDELEDGTNKFTVYDALNARDVTLTPRQIELVRRLQSGAFAHPEHDANPDYIDYFSGVDPIQSGLNSNRYENKARFQPSKWEKLQVRRLLHRLKCGSINMDYLEGKVRDMNDLVKRGDGEQNNTDIPFALWKGDEEDELALRKGPQHMPAPKVPPPGHAYSYNPPEEYLPTEDELKEWEELDPIDRPHGLFIPRKFTNLRSVGAYEHSVRERFERCLDLYLCPRAAKRRLNIDPESLVPQLPRASDLRPFPTTKCIRYIVPGLEKEEEEEEGAVPVRCLSVSPDGQFLVSGDENGIVRLWEVQTGRLLRSWDLNDVVSVGSVGGLDDKMGDMKNESKDTTSSDDKSKKKPIASLEWNPNRSHHCIIAAIGRCCVIISTGTGGLDDSEVTDALLSVSVSCKDGGNIAPESRAAKAVTWSSLVRKQRELKSSSSSTAPVSAYAVGKSGPIVILQTNKDVSSVRWHRKGDYFVTVSPAAGAAAVLIHQLSRASSQQPFGKTKGGETQLACFHPHKPFLLVATREHVRVYHLVKQIMVKRLVSGCRHISSMDVHVSGDHVILGSLDRRLVWFDLDLASTPYKTLKYHERALRSVGFHPRYPLMASAADDGSVHVFHSMVYSDLMRNPLIVPVKVLRAHTVTKSLGALSMVFHPTQPWLFSAGADGSIHLFQDI